MSHPATCATVTNAGADGIVTHDEVPLTSSLNPASESSLCLLLIDVRLRNDASTTPVGENDAVLGATVCERGPCSLRQPSYTYMAQFRLKQLIFWQNNVHFEESRKVVEATEKKTTWKSGFDWLLLNSLATTGSLGWLNSEFSRLTGYKVSHVEMN